MFRHATIALTALACLSFGCFSNPGGPDGGAGSGAHGSSGSSSGGAGTTGAGSSGGSSSSGGTAGLPFGQLEQADATAYCQSANACQPEAAYYQSGCVANLDSMLFDAAFGQIAADIDAGRVAYDATAAAACVQAEGSLGCGISGVPEPAACAQVFAGLLPLGAACYDYAECDAGYCTAATSSVCPGVCTAYLPSGGDCGDGGTCPPSEQCRFVAFDGGVPTASACQSPGAIGAVCVGSQDCAYPATCVGGTCASAGALGSPCSPGASDPTCQGGLYCETVDGGSACAAQVAQGGPCGEDFANASTAAVPPGQGGQCAAGLVCAGFHTSFTGTTPGVCQPAADVGGSCAPASDGGFESVTGCLGGLACVGGSCRIPPTSGPCSADPSVRCSPLGYFCDPATQTCQPQLASGSTCQSALNGTDCRSGYCDQTGHCVSFNSVCSAP